MAEFTYADLNVDLSVRHPITNDITRVFDTAAINNSIRNLLFTKRGTIPFSREKGTNLWRLVGELNTVRLRNSIQSEIYETIVTQEPRVNLIDVSVEQDRSNPNALNVNVVYSIKQSGQRGNFYMNLALNR